MTKEGQAAVSDASRRPGAGGLAGWPFGISRRVAILAVAVALSGFLALSEALHGQILRALAVADPLFAGHPVLGAVLFVVLAALSAVMVFFSGVILVPVGMQTWGKAGCFLLLWCGWVLGGLAMYAVGRRFGRPLVRRMLSAGSIARYESLIPERGSFLTATLVQLALPSDVSGYFFGLLGYRAPVYLGALALAELPYALGAVYIGAAFIDRQYWLLLPAAAVAAAAFAWVRRHHRNRRSPA
jgi:uncharacterized membrane protein YdjX (TVP38/TMEM64 family)